MRFLSFLLAINLLRLHAQPSEEIFWRKSVNNPTSQSWVLCIQQDSTGYLWFGTTDGIFRYDGSEYKHFRPLTVLEEEIGEVYVNALLYTTQTGLMAGTSTGLYRYDPGSASFVFDTSLRRSYIRNLVLTDDKHLWVGTTAGIYHCHLSKDRLETIAHYTTRNSNLDNDYINVLYSDQYKRIWIGTREGLQFYSPERGFIGINSIINTSLFENQVVSICQDNHDRLWIGSLQGGLDVLNNLGTLKGCRVTTVLKGEILALHYDPKGYLWAGAGSGGGLYRISLKDEKIAEKDSDVVHYQYSQASERSLPDNSISSIYGDKTGDIWIGTFSGGASMFSYRNKPFRNVNESLPLQHTIKGNIVNVVHRDDNLLWIGTNKGLNCYDYQNDTWSFFAFQSQSGNRLKEFPVFSISTDKSGKVWVGTWGGGVNVLDRKGKLLAYYFPNRNPNSLSNPNVFNITEDKRGFVWLGTIGGGLNRLDPSTGLIKCFRSEKAEARLFNNSVNQVYITADSTLYVSVYNAIEEYDYEKEQFTTFPLVSAEKADEGVMVTQFIEERGNNLWVGTNIGLAFFDRKHKQFRRIPLPEQNLSIKAILKESEDILWMSTNKGILQVSFDSNKSVQSFRMYSYNEGVPGKNFRVGASFRDNNGWLYFGSSLGFTFFHPDSFRINEEPPTVVISEFMVLLSKPDQDNKYVPYTFDRSAGTRIRLSYQKNNFIIKFATLNFLNPERNQYRYMLKGYDSDWVIAGPDRSATYTNIPHGRYTFLVSGTNNDGVWSREPASIEIRVTPPLLKTFIAKILLIMAGLMLLVTFHRLRIGYLEHRRRVLEKQVRERTAELSEMNTILEERQEEIFIQNEELTKHRANLEQLVKERTAELNAAMVKAEVSDKLKSSFLANMSHEIRTPMNAIVGFASLLDEPNLPREEKRAYTNIINSNSNALLVLINDILDVSLIEADQLNLAMHSFNPDEILQEMESYYRLKNSKELEIVFEKIGPQGITEVYNDPVRFRQVVSNLLSNAYKYTERGTIRFGYKQLDNEFKFYVADTGIGIPKEFQSRIFDHFYKVEEVKTQLHRGAGIGLSLCRKLIHLMGGRLWFESDVGNGSIFWFSLPIVDKITAKPEFVNINLKKNIDMTDYSILVAEDETDNYLLVETILKPYHPKIIWAKNGREAVEYFTKTASKEKHIVLMDIKMPVMDGFEAKKKIKNIDKSIPIIAITAYALSDDRDKIMKARFDDYIAKPIRPDELIKLISRFLQN